MNTNTANAAAIALDLGVETLSLRVLRDSNGSFVSAFPVDTSKATVLAFITDEIRPAPGVRFSCYVEDVDVDSETGAIIGE